jgi:phage head maturation protease
MSAINLYGNFQKVDSAKRMVYGYASTEARDNAGETVLKAAVEAALGDYLEYANIREMHGLSAVGVAEEVTTDDKGVYVGAKIVDDVAWGKVTSGVYKGFSIGGKTLARDPKDRSIITKIMLNEISLVDRPSNPEARFDVWKASGAKTEAQRVADALAAMSPDERAMAITKAALKLPHKIGAWK